MSIYTPDYVYTFCTTRSLNSGSWDYHRLFASWIFLLYRCKVTDSIIFCESKLTLNLIQERVRRQSRDGRAWTDARDAQRRNDRNRRQQAGHPVQLCKTTGRWQRWCLFSLTMHYPCFQHKATDHRGRRRHDRQWGYFWQWNKSKFASRLTHG